MAEDRGDPLFSESMLRFFDELRKRDVRFMVVGVAGATLYGSDIGTGDVDIWVEGLGSQSFCEAALAAGGFYRPPTGYDLQPPRLIGVGLDFLDLVLQMSGLGPFAEEYAHVKWLPHGETQIPVLALHRIIRSKEVAARPKDLDVLPLLRRKERELSEPYRK